MKKALITGITGQDGSYMAELLLEKGYDVTGLIRPSAYINTERINHIINNLKLVQGDLTDVLSLFKIVEKAEPDEIYNLGAQAHVGASFNIPEYTARANGLSVETMLEAIKIMGAKTKFYQAGSSELFGRVLEAPQTETTPFRPRSPYGVAKAYAFWTAVNYRENHGIFSCNGIMYNHESPRRSDSFVTRKVTKSLARIKLGKQNVLLLGNMDSKRDWGYSKDYVEGMWKMLQHSNPDDYILATGITHSIRDLVEAACQNLDIKIEWTGQGAEEKGIDKNTGNVIVQIDKNFYRPKETEILVGDNSKAKKILKWKPKTSFESLVQMMVENDYKIESKI